MELYNGPQKLDQGISKLWDEEALNSERWDAMTLKRRQHSAQSKAMIALEAVKERKTVNELAAEYRNPPDPQSASGNGSC